VRHSKDSGVVIKFLTSAGSSSSSATVLLWRRCSNKSNASRLRIPPFLSRVKQALARN